jgi:hypothetical protein
MRLRLLSKYILKGYITIFFLSLISCFNSNDIKCTIVPSTGLIEVNNPFFINKIEYFYYDNDDVKNVTIKIDTTEKINAFNIFQLDSNKNYYDESEMQLPSSKYFEYKLIMVYVYDPFNPNGTFIYNSDRHFLFGSNDTTKVLLDRNYL